MSAPGRRNSLGWPWTIAAAATGFLASFIFSQILHLSPAMFVLAYAMMTSAFVVVYVRRQSIAVGTQLERRWRAGSIGGILVGALLTRQVFTQAASAHATGATLAMQLVWFGIVYGVVDALMLSVVPVLSLYGMRPTAELRRGTARLRSAAIAVAGSIVVTTAYHAGFAEFRGASLLQPLIGNTIITLAYLLTGSPVAAIVSHVMMHAAAVMHGMATTMQLPPHY